MVKIFKISFDELLQRMWRQIQWYNILNSIFETDGNNRSSKLKNQNFYYYLKFKKNVKTSKCSGIKKFSSVICMEEKRYQYRWCGFGVVFPLVFIYISSSAVEKSGVSMDWTIRRIAILGRQKFFFAQVVSKKSDEDEKILEVVPSFFISAPSSGGYNSEGLPQITYSLNIKVVLILEKFECSCNAP